MEHDAAEREKEKREPRWRSYHEKMEDKAYAFNYYADKHQRGGMECDGSAETKGDQKGKRERTKHEKILLNVMSYGLIVLTAVPIMVYMSGYKRRDTGMTTDTSVDQEFLRWVDEVEEQNKENSGS